MNFFQKIYLWSIYCSMCGSTYISLRVHMAKKISVLWPLSEHICRECFTSGSGSHIFPHSRSAPAENEWTGDKIREEAGGWGAVSEAKGQHILTNVTSRLTFIPLSCSAAHFDQSCGSRGCNRQWTGFYRRSFCEHFTVTYACTWRTHSVWSPAPQHVGCTCWGSACRPSS